MLHLCRARAKGYLQALLAGNVATANPIDLRKELSRLEYCHYSMKDLLIRFFHQNQSGFCCGFDIFILCARHRVRHHKLQMSQTDEIIRPTQKTTISRGLWCDKTYLALIFTPNQFNYSTYGGSALLRLLRSARLPFYGTLHKLAAKSDPLPRTKISKGKRAQTFSQRWQTARSIIKNYKRLCFNCAANVRYHICAYISTNCIQMHRKNNPLNASITMCSVGGCRFSNGNNFKVEYWR